MLISTFLYVIQNLSKNQHFNKNFEPKRIFNNSYTCTKRVSLSKQKRTTL